MHAIFKNGDPVPLLHPEGADGSFILIDAGQGGIIQKIGYISGRRVRSASKLVTRSTAGLQ